VVVAARKAVRGSPTEKIGEKGGVRVVGGGA